jgi:hypothetical protein
MGPVGVDSGLPTIRQLSAYSVEKLQIHVDVIFRRSERTSFDPSVTCAQADARPRTEASAAT